MPKGVEHLAPVFRQDVLDEWATGKAVADCRKDMGIPQKSLAIEMGIGQALLSNLERGRRLWTMQRFKMAKDALSRLVK